MTHITCARATVRCVYTTPEAIYTTTLNALRIVPAARAYDAFPSSRYPAGPPVVRQHDVNHGYIPKNGYEGAAISLVHFLRTHAELVPLRYLQKLPGPRCCLRTAILALPDANSLQVRECDMHHLFPTSTATSARRATWEAYTTPLAALPRTTIVNHQGQPIPDTLFLLRASVAGAVVGYVVANRFNGTYSDHAPSAPTSLAVAPA